MDLRALDPAVATTGSLPLFQLINFVVFALRVKKLISPPAVTLDNGVPIAMYLELTMRRFMVKVVVTRGISNCLKLKWKTLVPSFCIYYWRKCSNKKCYTTRQENFRRFAAVTEGDARLEMRT